MAKRQRKSSKPLKKVAKKATKKPITIASAIKVLQKEITKHAGFSVTSDAIRIKIDPITPPNLMLNANEGKTLVCRFRDGVFSCEWE